MGRPWGRAALAGGNWLRAAPATAVAADALRNWRREEAGLVMAGNSRAVEARGRTTKHQYTAFSSQGNALPPQRVQLELAEVHLEALRLEQNLPRRRIYVVALVHRLTVDDHRDGLALADALDPRPLAEGAFHVILAARVDQLLEERFVLVPPQLSLREGALLAAR